MVVAKRPFLFLYTSSVISHLSYKSFIYNVVFTILKYFCEKGGSEEDQGYGEEEEQYTEEDEGAGLGVDFFDDVGVAVDVAVDEALATYI